MKKILLIILMLFNFSFAGETGYILLTNEIEGISSTKLSNIGTVIKIPKNTYIYKDINILDNIYSTNKNNIEECISTETYFCNKKDVKVKILSYVKFNERIFVLVSNIENLKSLDKENFEKIIKKEISEYSLCLKEDDIIFSCETDNKKIISFCLNENGLLYKYGTKNKGLELEYGSIPNQDINLFFEFAHDDYSKGKSDQLVFKKGKFVYTFFSESHVYNPSLAGIVVEKENKKIVQINCNKKFTVDYLYKIDRYFKFNKSELRYPMEIEGE